VQADSLPFSIRNQNPVLQVFGLPVPQGGTITSRNTLQNHLTFSLANHANRAQTADERIVLDGESYYLDAQFRYGFAERWEVGLDVPHVTHTSGTLDNFIEGWHGAFGFSNSQRDGPSNRLEMRYERHGTTELLQDRDSRGIGDIRLTGAYQLVPERPGGRSLALRGLVKLPTGQAKRLRGSGATDLALSLEMTDHQTLSSYQAGLFLQAGALLLGDGDVLPDLQRKSVAFGALGLQWHWTDNVHLAAQLSLQSRYFDSSLDELGGSTSSLSVGGGLALRRLGIVVDLAIIEDLISDTTPDFGIYLSVRPLASSRSP
jgi:hypothetical protein